LSYPAETYVGRMMVRLAHPLDRCYARLGRQLPPLAEVHPLSLPQPYRRLLVHEDDMTPTLEAFHGGPVQLQVLSRDRSGDEYFREVLLVLEKTGRPVEFGAIKINLDRFDAVARRHILEERQPLGHILETDAVRHLCRPRAFLRLAADHWIAEALQLHGAHVLYGRSNALRDLEGRALAEVVEILPPEAAVRETGARMRQP
jgi:chorismate-pyruvate lyase